MARLVFACSAEQIAGEAIYAETGLRGGAGTKDHRPQKVRGHLDNDGFILVYQSLLVGLKKVLSPCPSEGGPQRMRPPISGRK